MKTVNILLSTYNGEKYLGVQLDSLLAQTYMDISIYIRDDGSTDHTVEIIKKYQDMPGGEKIFFLKDEEGNLGYVKSFLTILRRCEKADYYAFCDQDDYWFPNKIERAVQALNRQDENRCQLYTSAYSVCNDELKVIGDGHRPSPFEALSVGRSLSLYDGGWLLGFTCVINEALRHRAFDNQIWEMYSHDIWVQAVAVAMGGAQYYDEEVTVYFRRHGNSTSVAETGMVRSCFTLWKYRWNETFGNGKMFVRLNGGIQSFAKAYQQEPLSKEDLQFLKIFSQSKKGLVNKVRKVLYPHRLKKRFVTEMAWRMAILIGRI